ncbi:phage integrase SAM-like domain-containing protein, partial [Candidatus Roizmanbacteria bacterium]|nr:phage integrase SAM-like domain-containing protein [Candidatus Roizmanbacteria bacterium]
LQASFREYLLSGNKELTSLTIRNYQSDLRHFLGWYLFFLKASPKYTQSVGNTGKDFYPLFSILNKEIIEAYKDYLRQNKIPLKTVNRRLSTLRKFCSFCIYQRWLSENPAKGIANSGTAKESKNILIEFKRALEQDETIPLEVREITNDIEEFLLVSRL